MRVREASNACGGQLHAERTVGREVHVEMAHLKAQAQHVLLQLVRFDAARAMRRVGSIL
jgi:hypothetical protein